MSVTTATVWVCSYCGQVSHLDGTAAPYQSQAWTCPPRASVPPHDLPGRHSFKPVLVVVPYA